MDCAVRLMRKPERSASVGYFSRHTLVINLIGDYRSRTKTGVSVYGFRMERVGSK